jgi:hypothetical protein
MSAGVSWAGHPDEHVIPRHGERKAGGIVLPARAKVHGHSLAEVARRVAAFNVTDHSGTPPELPFQMLYTTATNTFEVGKRDFFYVPVWQNDDSYPAVGQYPNVSDRAAVLNYLNSQDEFGLVESVIVVDGKEYDLDTDYVAAVKLKHPLTDFLPPATAGGKQYMTVAAFLSPMRRGTHTVEIRGLATGDAIAPWSQVLHEVLGIDPFTEMSFSITYTVNVH